MDHTMANNIKKHLTFHTSHDLRKVRFLVPMPSGQLLCGGSDGCLSLINAELSKVETVKISGGAASASTLSAVCLLDSQTLMAGTVDGSLCRLRLDAEKCHGEVLQQSPSGMSEVEALAIHPLMLTKLAVADSAGLVSFYDLDSKQLLSSAGPLRGAVTSMAWHPKGQLLVLGLESGTLHGLFWEDGMSSESDPADIEIKATLIEPTEVTAAHFSPDGSWLAVGHRDGRVQVLAAHSTCSLTQYRQLPGNASAIMDLQFTKDWNDLIWQLQRIIFFFKHALWPAFDCKAHGAWGWRVICACRDDVSAYQDGSTLASNARGLARKLEGRKGYPRSNILTFSHSALLSKLFCWTLFDVSIAVFPRAEIYQEMVLSCAGKWKLARCWHPTSLPRIGSERGTPSGTMAGLYT